MIQKHADANDELQRVKLLNNDLEIQISSLRANEEKLDEEVNANIETIKILNESLALNQ